MNILFAAIKKEIRQLKRNVSLLVIIGASPLLIMGIIPFSIEKRVKISLSVVDCDNSAASRIMTYRVKASPYFVKVTEMERVEEALDRVKENKSDMVMILPEKMERDAGEVEAAPLSIALDGTHTLNAQSHFAFLEQMLQYDLSEGDPLSYTKTCSSTPPSTGGCGLLSHCWFCWSHLSVPALSPSI